MTEQTQPTDAEILDTADDFRSQYKHGGTTFDEFDALGFARAVLAKWGTPAGAGEPIAWFVTEHSDVLDIEWNRLKPTYPGAWRPLYTTPQPTQAQAGAVPLTVQYPEGYGNPFAKIAYDAGWRAAEHAHGIKGADHG